MAGSKGVHDVYAWQASKMVIHRSVADEIFVSSFVHRFLAIVGDGSVLPGRRLHCYDLL
jgi:hypothetical protein